jgi:uncharacterized protein YaeQ
MALPSTIYRVTIQLSDIDRGRYETLQTTVARHPSETAERLVARLLAYALFYEPELAFTKGISAGDEPDLWLKGADGRVLLWVEVGLPEPERLLKAGRHAERVVLVTCGRSSASWERMHSAKLEGMPNLTVVGIDQTFIDGLAARLERVIGWSVTVTEGALYLDIDGDTMETDLRVCMGRAMGRE